MRPTRAQIGGPVLTAAVLILFVVLDATIVRIQNPAPIFLIAVTFAGYTGGLRPALASALLAIVFSVYYFSVPGKLFGYSQADEARLVAIVIGTVTIAVMSGVLRERLVRAERRSARERLERERNAERQLVSDSETRLRATVDVALDALVSMGADGRITEWNQSAEQMFGWPRDSAIGQEMASTILPERYREAHRAGLRRYLETGHGRVIGRRIEIEALHRDGHELPIELAISVIQTSSGLGFTAFLRDISARRRLEAAQAAALVEVQHVLRLRDEFLAAAAHDLKTPLTALKGQLQLIRRRLGDAAAPAVAHSLDEADRASQRMADLVNELLDLARVQSGQTIPLEREEVDLVALVRAVAESAARQAPRHEISVDAKTPSLVGRWDPRRIERALTNLVSNAVKYSPSGGGVVLTTDREQAGEQAWAVIAVRDRGIGIPAADLPQLFTRFRRGSNVKGVDGTGIGLEATRRSIELHGGTIKVDSEEGAGTTMTVRLPLNGDGSG